MLFMIIERFKDNDMVPVYQRLRAGGRAVPDGLRYVDSWVAPNFSRCFQVMECDDLRALQQWVLHWRGSGVTFENRARRQQPADPGNRRTASRWSIVLHSLHRGGDRIRRCRPLSSIGLKPRTKR